MNTSKDIKKQTSSLEAIEALIQKYKRRIEIISSEKYKLFGFSKSLIYFFKMIYFSNNFYLNLIKNNLFRIFDKSIKDIHLRKLIKLEIFVAPKRTFTDFINLYNDIKQELY